MLFEGRKYSIKSKDYAEALRKGIEQLLTDDETLIGFYKTTNKLTYYITIQKAGTIEFQQFRLSTHKAKYSFYSNRTFLMPSNRHFSELAIEIREYLDRAAWYMFKYEYYFTLKVLQMTDRRRMGFYIENLFDVFEGSQGKMVFYQKHKTWKDNSMRVVNESLQQQLRALFAQGLLSSYPSQGDFEVYITLAGRVLLEENESAYLEEFKQDLKKVKWIDIEVPVKEETKDFQ
ncbi:hypothetical protein [Gracilibacillus alcaliphilus]|uniref:hypothetical protein n=1 Tax=Gracilibacillus alcaliphilus TaxID=1401441 RepID=UPI00195C8629|nr:hypothetical protein [Gracilibacillus alcaliphilus]MBM7676207.1 hypothetical protein [Gracilibacillus alcaliphilus]